MTKGDVLLKRMMFLSFIINTTLAVFQTYISEYEIIGYNITLLLRKEEDLA